MLLLIFIVILLIWITINCFRINKIIWIVWKVLIELRIRLNNLIWLLINIIVEIISDFKLAIRNYLFRSLFIPYIFLYAFEFFIFISNQHILLFLIFLITLCINFLFNYIILCNLTLLIFTFDLIIFNSPFLIFCMLFFYLFISFYTFLRMHFKIFTFNKRCAFLMQLWIWIRN